MPMRCYETTSEANPAPNQYPEMRIFTGCKGVSQFRHMQGHWQYLHTTHLFPLAFSVSACSYVSLACSDMPVVTALTNIPAKRGRQKVAYGDQEVLVQFMRFLHSLRECKKRMNCTHLGHKIAYF